MSSIDSSTVQISLNGAPHAVGQGASVADLLAQLGADPRKVAVELNLAILPRSQYAATALAEGDKMELVGFIGGG